MITPSAMYVVVVRGSSEQRWHVGGLQQPWGDGKEGGEGGCLSPRQCTVMINAFFLSLSSLFLEHQPIQLLRERKRERERKLATL